MNEHSGSRSEARRVCRERHAGLGSILLVFALLLVGLIFSACGEEPAAVEPDRAQERALLDRLAAEPGNVAARLALANYYYDNGQPRRAIPVYLEVLRAHPDSPDVRTDLGTCYKRLGDLPQARATYEAVLQKHPRHTQALFNLGVVLNALGDYETAADAWEKAAASTQDANIIKLAKQNALTARAAHEQRRKAGSSTTTVPDK